MGKKSMWKDIPKYKGKYQVSRTGKIKNVRTGRILKLRNNNRGGYLMVGLSNNGSFDNHLVSRIVANTFVKKLKGNLEVHHIDENIINNHYKNLLVVPPGIHRHKKRDDSHDRVPVIGIKNDSSVKGDKILIYKTSGSAHKDGFKWLGKILQGGYRHCKGYDWYYTNEKQVRTIAKKYLNKISD